MEKNHKKTTDAWCMYDWANSVYSLVITSAIFPGYYEAVTASTGSDVISFFGWEVVNTVLYSYAISFSFLIVVFLTPALTGIADYCGNKKQFMKFFCYMGGLSCMGLYFFTVETLELSVILFVLAGVGFSGSIVFYNAYLPEIATEDQYDRLSARGFAMGYIGSVLLLIINLIMISYPEWFWGISSGYASRIAFFTVGVWWIGFAQYSFYHLPKNVYNRKPSRQFIINGFKELISVLRQLPYQPLLKTFLLAFFFYSMGVQTVMYVATIFGKKVLDLSQMKLIITILIIQLVAIGGAHVFARISKFRGNIFSLLIMIVIWVGVCVAAYFVYTDISFYVLAAFVGLVMGGIQSMSRSTYSKFIPGDTQDHASYFSFFDVTEKLAIVIGTSGYGLIEQLTGDMRNSVLLLALLFVIGFFLLLRLPNKTIYPVKSV